MLLRVHRKYYTHRILYNHRHLSPLPIHCIKVCAGIKEGGEGGFAKLSLHFLFELYYSHTHASLSIYFSIIFKFYFLLSPNFFFKKLIIIFFLFTTFHLTETIHKSRRTTTTSKSKPTNHTLKYTNLDADYTSSATSHCHTWYVQQLSNPIKHISSHNQTIHSHKFFTKSNPQPNKPWQPHGR